MDDESRETEKSHFKKEGLNVDLKLLLALILDGRNSKEIQLLVDNQSAGSTNFHALALILTGRSVDENLARETLMGLVKHQQLLQKNLGHPINIKNAASDYLECLERALGVQVEKQAYTYTQLEQMAFKDYLTGLSNFRYFSAYFSDEIKKAERYHRMVSLIMIDIDHFKKFNDRFGHEGGNRVLKLLAEMLPVLIRDTDFVARYGGEEFVVILFETSKHKALQVAEHIRREVEQTPFYVKDDQREPLTISLGVANFPRDARSPEGLISASDEALYASKHDGRNRISAYRPKTSAELSFFPVEPNLGRDVCVVGDFNVWDREADPLAMDQDGSFRIKLELTPGIYQYKFLVDHILYIKDPLCLESIGDGFGGENSVLVVKDQVSLQ